jgi:hypothetical protein
MAKGDSTGASQYAGGSQGIGPQAQNTGQWLPPAVTLDGAQRGGVGYANTQPQQNNLFQGMDPRLVNLFNQYGVNPTGAGTGNSDIGYWNQKITAPGADANYYLGRLGSDFAGTGPDLANNANISYQPGFGQGAQRQYQQPMQRRFGFGAGGRFGQQGYGFRPTQGYSGFGGGYRPQYGGGGGVGYGGYRTMGNNPWGQRVPQPNTSTITQPLPKQDTSENP